MSTAKKRILYSAILLLTLALIIAVVVLLVKLLLRQSRYVEVEVETSGENYTESVKVKVSNILGMDLLIDESDKTAAMLQYNNDGTWIDVREIRFLHADKSVLSGKYGGSYIHLPPGGNLEYKFSDDALTSLKSGEYRVAIRYITEQDYLLYLQKRAQTLEASLTPASEAVDAVVEETSAEETSFEPEPVAPPALQTYYTVFYFTSREDGIDEPAVTSGDVAVSIGMN